MSDDHIAANIRRARLQRGLTQTALAKRLGVKQAAVSQWESSQSLPELKTRIELATILEIRLAQVGIPVKEIPGQRLVSKYVALFVNNYLALDPASRELVEKVVARIAAER